MAGKKNAPAGDYCRLTLLSINTALHEGYRRLSLSVRVPYKFLTPEDIGFVGLLEFLSALAKERKNIQYQGHGIAILPKHGGIGTVLLCDELLGEYFGLPIHSFASNAWRRSLLAHYVSALLLAGALGFSGSAGNGRKKRKLALGIMHAASHEHYRHFAHSRFIRDVRKTASLKCDRVRSDFRELGVTDTDLLYALEKKPGPHEERAIALQNEISETDTLLRLIEKKKSAPLSGKTALQLAVSANFLRRMRAALARTYRRRAYWDISKAFKAGNAARFHIAIEALAACERIPVKNLIQMLDGLQPYKKRILMSLL